MKILHCSFLPSSKENGLAADVTVPLPVTSSVDNRVFKMYDN